MQLLAAFGEDLCFLVRSLGAGAVLEAPPHILGDASGTAGHRRSMEKVDHGPGTPQRELELC